MPEFEKVVASLRIRADEIVGLKRQDYTQHSKDVLANFKRAAEHAGITPMQVWLVFFNKHYSAVASYVQKPLSQTSEPIIDRFADLRNYLDLGWALINDPDVIANLQEPRCDAIKPLPLGSGLPVDKCICNKGHLGMHTASDGMMWE